MTVIGVAVTIVSMDGIVIHGFAGDRAYISQRLQMDLFDHYQFKLKVPFRNNQHDYTKYPKKNRSSLLSSSISKTGPKFQRSNTLWLFNSTAHYVLIEIILKLVILFLDWCCTIYVSKDCLKPIQ